MRRTLQEQIQSNKRASVVYALLLVVLLGALGATFVGAYEPSAWPLGAVVAAALGAIVALVGHFQGSRLVLRMSQAREPRGLEYSVLNNVAEEMAIAAGIPKPQVLVIDDSAPNAFATGPDPARATVVFTTGLMAKLDRDELQGVMAHEIAHIRNYDIRFMTTIAMVAGLIPLLADFMLRVLFRTGGRSRSSSRDSGGLAIVFLVMALVLAILAPLFAKLLEMAVSRKREFLADATAAELTRYPEGLARALQKISSDREELEVANRATQHMYIVNPMKAWEKRAALFSTHPPIEQRVAALMNLMGAYRREPRAVHDYSDMPDLPDLRT